MSKTPEPATKTKLPPVPLRKKSPMGPLWDFLNFPELWVGNKSHAELVAIERATSDE